MKPAQSEDFKAIDNVANRARFLLDIGVTAITDIDQLELVYRAKCGRVVLPITADTEEEAIRKGINWLREKAGLEATDAS